MMALESRALSNIRHAKALLLLLGDERREKHHVAAIGVQLRRAGMNVVLYSPTVDDRDGVGVISSRIGLSREAVVFNGEHDFFVDLRARSQQQDLSCVLVDEAQFLSPKQVLQLTLVCDRLSIPVICYGIRTDFRGEPFEGSKYLLAWADEIVEIKTICHTGSKATMNARLDEDGNRVTSGSQIDIGTHYVALSRKEFGLEQVSPIEYEVEPEWVEPVESVESVESVEESST